MTVRVPLRELIDGMQWQSDELTAYLNRKTGHVMSVTDEDLAAAESDETGGDRPGWEAEALEVARAILDGDEYVALPDRFGIDEYRMMERFASRVTDGAVRDRLGRAIQGRGAFRSFKESVHDAGSADEWYAYRDREYEEIAIAWCEANGVEYTRDQPAQPTDA